MILLSQPRSAGITGVPHHTPPCFIFLLMKNDNSVNKTVGEIDEMMSDLTQQVSGLKI